MEPDEESGVKSGRCTGATCVQPDELPATLPAAEVVLPDTCLPGSTASPQTPCSQSSAFLSENISFRCFLYKTSYNNSFNHKGNRPEQQESSTILQESANKVLPSPGLVGRGVLSSLRVKLHLLS